MDFNNHLNHKTLKSNRTHLRHHSTPAEKGLWQLLKNKQADGLKFRRQYSIGTYIVDFYCPEIRLAIELDGQVHVGNERYDERREDLIKEIADIHIIRYENKFVFEHPECILEDIREYRERYSTAPPSQATVPPAFKGGEPR